LAENSHSKLAGTKANALLCPTCCVEYKETQFDLEVDGAILRNVKALRCPSCGEEQFSPEQIEAVIKQAGENKQ